MDIRVPTWELGVRYFWRGFAKRGVRTNPPNPPPGYGPGCALTYCVDMIYGLSLSKDNTPLYSNHYKLLGNLLLGQSFVSWKITHYYV